MQAEQKTVEERLAADTITSSTDGLRLVAGGYDGRIKVWEVLDTVYCAQVK